MRALLAALAIAASTAGCELGGDSCLRNSDCAPPLVCGGAGVCALPPDGAGADGGAPDDATVDATVDGPVDGPDAPPIDGPDAPPIDAPVVDAPGGPP